MVHRVALNDRVVPGGAVPGHARAAPGGATFARILAEETSAGRDVRFSGHALQRMRTRGIELSSHERDHIRDAVDRAAAKGSRESLLLMDRCSLVVSVSNRTVITVVPRDETEGNVFTNIDSAVVVRNSAPLTATQQKPAGPPSGEAATPPTDGRGTNQGD